MQDETAPRKCTRISLDIAGPGDPARGAQAVFTPVWNVEKNYLCGYIIRPAGDRAPASAEDAAAGDIALLARAAAALGALRARGEKSVVVVPVGFETLNRYPGRGRYLSLLRRIPQDVRAFIVLKIGAIPPNAPKRRLLSVQGDVRGLCRALAFTAGIRGARLDCVSRRDVHACSANLDVPEPEAGDIVGLASRFAGKTQGIGCAPMAEGVSTRAALCAAIAAGFAYIAGAAVQRDQAELGISRRHFDVAAALAGENILP